MNENTNKNKDKKYYFNNISLIKKGKFSDFDLKEVKVKDTIEIEKLSIPPLKLNDYPN